MDNREEYLKRADIESVKKMSFDELRVFLDETRKYLIESVLQTGGHLASNLGAVEISAALIRCLDPEKDRIIYDTGHQSYVHKLLTGRAEKFSSLRTFGGISGFPKRDESPYDAFGTGHSGTGLSAALGFAKASKLDGEKNWSAVVVGDGSLPGGEVFEALNNLSRDDRVIIILNDNKMSISKSVGALKHTLNMMRTAGYYKTKDSVENFLLKLPLFGNALYRFLRAVKTGVKRLVLPAHNIFEQYGLSYYGPSDGNNIETVEFLIKEAMKKSRPALIHLCTKKGKGYPPAESDPTSFHGVSPKNAPKPAGVSFSKAFGEKLTSLAEKDRDIVAITAAMTDGVGLKSFADKFPSRLFDTGIAEEHALTFAASLSAAGKKPVFAVYSTFFQRSFDQLYHDAALQRLPMVIMLDRAGISGEDGATHHGLLDIAMANSAPGVKIYAPASVSEMELILERALSEWNSVTVIRYPRGSDSESIVSNFALSGNTEKKIYGDGKKFAIVTSGRLTEKAHIAARSLEEKGIGTTLIRFCALKGQTDDEIREIFEGMAPDGILFVEEGMKNGSFSQNLVSRMAELGILTRSNKKILAPDETFIPHGSVEELFSLVGFTPENIVRELVELGKN